MIFYVVLVVPLYFDISAVMISVSYSVVLVRLFGVMVKNFGKGDVKVLQTIAVAMPVYFHLPSIDSLFPPVLSVVLLASILGTIASFVNNPKHATSIREYSPSPAPETLGSDKFWTDGSKKRTYKIPFVTFIFVGYTVLLILSSLRLV